MTDSVLANRHVGRVMGLDEAGRGAVVGPLVVGAVTVGPGGEDKLAALGVADSKQLTAVKRSLLAPLVMDQALFASTLPLNPTEVDQALANPLDNLNLLEVRAMVGLIAEHPPDLVIVDAVSKPPYFSREVALVLKGRSDVAKVRLVAEDRVEVRWADPSDDVPAITTVVARNKADQLFPVVSAASILAKVARDKAIRTLESQHSLPNGILASGYPNKQLYPFLETYRDQLHRQLLPFVRYRWAWPPLQQILHPSKTRQTKLRL